MMYVFDTNSLSNVLNHYYFERFPTFWEKFFQMIDEKRIVSVREARHELEERFEWPVISNLTDHNADFFGIPGVEELEFVRAIYAIPHFQQNLERKKLLKGGYLADPFIIARARLGPNGVVISEENLMPGAAKVPNICQHFGIPCEKLEGFLTKENWTF